MRFFLLGGLGQIGLATATALSRHGSHAITVVDVVTPNAHQTAALERAGATYLRSDLVDGRDLATMFQPGDRVFLGAARITSAFRRDPAAALALNVDATNRVYTSARESGAELIVLASSIAVYGARPVGLIDEDHPADLNGMSPEGLAYASCKWLGEALGRQIVQAGGSRCIALRYSTVYGPTQHAEGLYSEAIRRIYLGLPPTEVFPGLTSLGYHDYIAIDDAAAATVAALTSDGRSGSYNVGSGVTSGPREIADVLGTHGLDTPDAQLLPSEPPFRLSTQRAREELGWEAAIDLGEGIAHAIPGWTRDGSGTAGAG